MSYAQVAASGPAQSPEEARAPPVPSIQPEETPSTLIDVDSPHVAVVKSDFEEQEVKTTTQAERLEREAEDKARAEQKKAEQKAAEAKQKAEEKAQEAKQKADEKAQEAKEKAEELKQKAATKAKEVKAELKKDAKKIQENSDNPVFIGNAILWTVTAVALGYGAYKKHSEGKLDIQLVGTVAAGLGVLGAVDYLGSKWLVENKYPAK